MADNKNIIEYTFKGSFEGADEVIREVDRINQRVSESMGTGTPNPAAAASAAGYGSFSSPAVGGALPPPAQPTTDPGIPVGSLSDYQQRVQAVQAIAPNAPDVANMMASRLQTSILNSAVRDPEMAKEHQDLVNTLKELRQSIQDDGKKKDGIGDLLGWMKAQALLQTTQHIGSSIANNAMQGNFISAGGGTLGAIVGGGLGLLGGPAGMVTGMGMGASIGSGIGGMVERILSGTGDAIKYETQIADINQRFGVGSVGRLRDYNQGGNLGFTAEQSAGLVDQLRENRALSNPAMAGPLVNVIQELTRALGLNVEATANMAGIYSRTGGEKGAEGVRGYLSDIVGGAIRAGFESNIQQYADMMGSARMQSTQQTGQAVSDRAFGVLQDVMAGLTGGDSRTSGLFRDNMQMAAGGLQTFMSFGGTTDPYSRQAAMMRLAGIEEGALDSRFNSPEQIAANAQRGIGFITERLQGMTGMSEAQFNAAAADDPNFVQNIVRSNSTRQRQTGAYVSSFINRQATGQDLRTFEELANIMAANGGQLPTGDNDGSKRVQELMGQLQESPGDRARNLEAQAHNETIKAMSNFMEAANKLKEWQVDALKWINTLDLKAVGDGIADAMDKVRKWATEAGPHIRNAGAAMIEAAHKVRDAAKDFAEMIKEFREGPVGKWLIGDGKDGFVKEGEINAGPFSVSSRDVRTSPMAQVPEAFSQGLDFYRRLFRGDFGNDSTRAWNYIQTGEDAGPTGRRRNTSNYRRPDDRFNDTPGSVMAGPGYDVFAFAPGDIISARMGGTSGGATLTDIHQVLTEGNVMAVQFEQNQSGRSKVLQDSTNNILATDLLIQTNSDLNTTKQFPALIDLSQFLAKAAIVRDGLLAKIEAHFPVLIGAVMSVGETIANLSSITGGNAGGANGAGFGVNQFPIPGMTLDSATITSGFGYRNIFGRRNFHEGIDIAAQGGTAVLAARSGTVSQIKPLADQLQIAIRSVDERGRQIEEWYIHTANAMVKVGDEVQAGQQIGEVAHTTDRARQARVSTGDHLDYRVKVDGEWVDPRTMLRGLPAGGTQASGGSTLGVDLIKQFEGFHPTPYWDHQQYSWGYGTQAPGRHGSITREQAEAELQRHLAGVNQTIDSLVRVPLNENQRAALQSFVYNVGGGQDGFAGSTLLRRLNRGDYEGAANEFRRWNKAGDEVLPGLVRRRQMEADLFRRPTVSRNLQASAVRSPESSGNRTNNITINIASATHPQETAQAIVAAARPYLDEHETNRQMDRNPRNNQSLSPVYG